jgi:hypothetical protein
MAQMRETTGSYRATLHVIALVMAMSVVLPGVLLQARLRSQVTTS